MPTNGQAVKIAHYTRSKFDSLTNKDSATIYYVEETDGKIKQYIGNTHVVSDDSGVVKLSGAQTISGEKTFNDGIIIPGSNKYIDLGNKNNWFWTRFSGENWTFNNNLPSGGWARNLMEMKPTEGDAYFRIGAQGSGQTFTQMYIGPAYNNYWLSLNNTRALFGTKPQYASNPTADNDLTRKKYVDDELDDKVDKVSGKGLSTNDYTTTEKNKLAGIATGAEVNVQSNWNATSGDAFILNKPTIPTNNNQLTNGAGYITGYTETDPIFTAWNKSTGISITKSQVSDLINATQSLSGLMSATDKTRLDVLHALLEEDTANNVVDSINEVLAIFNNYPEGADLVTALAGKVDKVEGKGLSTNDYTTTEKNKLSGIATGAQVNVGTNLSQGARNTTTLRIDSSTGNNLTLPAVTTELAGLMTSSDKVKLNGIATGANKLTAGTNITIDTNNKINVSGLDDYVRRDGNVGDLETVRLGTTNSSGFVDVYLGKKTGGSSIMYLSGEEGYAEMNLSLDLNEGARVANNKITNDNSVVNKKYVDDAVANITPSGTWKEVYSGTSQLLSETTYTSLTLNEAAIYYNRPMMMEIKFGFSGDTFTNQIVTFNVGTSSTTSNDYSRTSPRTVSITDFDGRYLKTIAVKVYVGTTGATSYLSVGHVKTLMGDFTGTSGKLTWTTEASDGIYVYIGKIWVMV